MNPTPCRNDPESWVSDDQHARALAAKECAACPLDMFTACQKLAKVDPFGVMAGRDYGVQFKTTRKEPEPRTADDIKECARVECGATIHRGRRSRGDWAKLRYCSRACYALTRTVQGLPESKPCERCGVVFPRAGRSPKHWRVARFCGVMCGNAKTPKEKAA